MRVLLWTQTLNDLGDVGLRPVLADLPLAIDRSDFDLDADDALQLRGDVGVRSVGDRP